jgi:2-phosphosulfolactate phosphatase
MNIAFATLETCATAEGLVVVIDVVRAFTTAAYAFAAGASEILLAGTVEEALALRASHPGARVMGEVGGFPPPGFDYGNSPQEMLGADLDGVRLIQRTSAGTQGIVRSERASSLLAASFVCAGATVRIIRQLAPDSVTFVVTGMGVEVDGDEDRACGEYMAALLEDGVTDPTPYLARVGAAIRRAGAVHPERAAMLTDDETFCTALDRFPFAMRVEWARGHYVMSAVVPS